MGIFAHWRALRALVFICGLLWVASVATARAATLLSPGPAVLIKKSAEPFGLATTILSEGGLRDKWLGVQRRLEDEMVQLALCDGDRDHCVSPAALKFLSIVDLARIREGRARFGEVNRAINLAVRATSDLVQYGQTDFWASPLLTFASGAGDCEDYAIAKLAALRLAGIVDEDLRLVILHDTVHGEDHAVAAARLEGRWLTLDNRRMAMVEDSEVRNYRPIFVIAQSAVMRYAEPPLMAEAAMRMPTQAE